MASPVLFSTGASPASSSSRNLVEFKAGKMEMRGKMVHPIKKQGLVYLNQSQDDNLMHFCWKDRQSGVVEDDLILFPDDCEFRRVKECTTGRVYVLKMKSSNKKMFFWMQESKTDRDDEFCKKINDMLNNPPRGGSDMGTSSSERDLRAILGNMTQEQVAQLLSSNGVNLTSILDSATGRSPSSNSGGSSSSIASTTHSAPASSNNNNNTSQSATAAAMDSSPNMNALQALLSNEDELNELMEAGMRAVGESPTPRGSTTDNIQGPAIDLAPVINSESLAHLLSNEEFLRQIEPHLPPVTQAASSTLGQQQMPQQTEPLNPQELRNQFSDTVRSSQFRSSLTQFCMALQSGQLGPLMSQFGLNQACVDAASLGNLEAFVRALETQMKPPGTSAPAPSDASQRQDSQDKPKDK